MSSGGKAEANLLRAAELWCQGAGGNRWEANGIVCTSAPVPMRSFNQAIITTPLTGAGSLRGAIRRFGRGRFRVRVRADLGAEIEAVMESAGLKRHGGIPNLVLERPAEAEAIAGEITLERVRDERTLRDHVSVVAEAFGWETEDLARVFTQRLLSLPDWRGWVAYAGAEPVATSQLVAFGEVAGIYYVATREGYRHRGFGQALTAAALREGFALGCDVAALQASPSGYPLYRQMGFRDAGEYLTYVPVLG